MTFESVKTDKLHRTVGNVHVDFGFRGEDDSRPAVNATRYRNSAWRVKGFICSIEHFALAAYVSTT